MPGNRVVRHVVGSNSLPDDSTIEKQPVDSALVELRFSAKTGRSSIDDIDRLAENRTRANPSVNPTPIVSDLKTRVLNCFHNMEVLR